MRRIDAVFTAIVLTIVTLGFAPAVADEPEPCVPQDAWTEVIEHEAIPAVPAVPPTPGQHYSWNGGDIPENEVPPAPPAGSWQANTEQEPHDNGAGNNVTWLAEVGSGLHYTGKPGNANWFYYALGTIGTPGTPEVPAWTETIEHDAITCDKEPPVDECLGENGEDLCVHEEPEPPVDNDPEPPVDSDEPKGYRETKCLAGALVTKNYDAQGNTVSTSTENGHPRCAPVDGEVFKEEGM